MYDVPAMVSAVEKAVHNAQQQSPLRVFALGIGDGVSSAMCEGIARAGKGVCLFAVNTESILGKCARLLRAGRTPFVQKVKIDWGISDEFLSSATSSVDVSTSSAPATSIKIQSLPATQQAPTKIQDIHASTRANVFVVLALNKITVPESITLHGELDDGSGTLELTIPVQTVQLEGTKNGKPLIHTLAAWRLIQEHEEKRAPLPHVGVAIEDEIRKGVIIHLGERYRLVSQHTSFVAVDYGRDDKQYSDQVAPAGREDLRDASDLDLPAVDNSLRRLGWSILDFFTGFLPRDHDMHGSNNWAIPGASADSPSSPSPVSDEGTDDGYESAESFSTLSSLEGSTEESYWSGAASPEPQMSEEDTQRQRSPSPNFEWQRLAPGQYTQADVGNTLPVQLPSPSVQLEVVELVRSQLYDGSFPLHALRGIVGANVVDEASKRQLDNSAWATAVSIVFIEKYMGSQKELMHDLLIKAREYLHGRPDMKELITLARKLIVT